MATRVTWLGHATLQIDTNGTRILIDPFFTGNPACPMTAEQATADHDGVEARGHSGYRDRCPPSRDRGDGCVRRAPI